MRGGYKNSKHNEKECINIKQHGQENGPCGETVLPTKVKNELPISHVLVILWGNLAPDSECIHKMASVQI